MKRTASTQYFVYILASKTKVLYVGVTNDLRRRVWEHHNEVTGGFTHRYRVHRLVYFEVGNSPEGAIGREKQIKGWRREKKVALIEAMNPQWNDLSEAWDQPTPTGHSEVASRRGEGAGHSEGASKRRP